MAPAKIDELLAHPIIQELSRALWRAGDLRGAAVMVGAGFSRNAELPGPTSQLAPTWRELEAAMRGSLGSHSGDSSDPLEVAQQYDAVFGRPALNGLIREQVPDLSLQPGILHRRLLRLPWSEVLTTNYDTLLERCAAKSPSQTFEVVSSQYDIPRTRSPRIVKLHGSLPTGPFIIAAEDYRTYPKRHAGMVNLVQQVLLENHLVLLGFSATDPNFLAWTGWVRDNLGDTARRLILVGMFDLSTGARRVLEARGVTVVDLSPLVEDRDANDRHSVALQYFFDALEKAKPAKLGTWELTAPPPDVQAPLPQVETEGAEGPKYWFDVDTARGRLLERVPSWIADRQRYPGWIVAPLHIRVSIQSNLSRDRPNLVEAIRSMAEPQRARVIYEIAWLTDVAMEDFSSWLLNEIELILRGENEDSLTSLERAQLALFALTSAREKRDEARFSRLRDWLAAHPPQDPDFLAMAAYEEAIWARDGLEYGRLPDLINRVGGRDPIFALRRATLWCELGAYDQAVELVGQALADLRERRSRDRNSIWVSSRYGWALYLTRYTCARR